MMKYKVEPKHYDTIADMRNEGATYKAIAEFFNVNPSTIEAIMAKVKRGRETSRKSAPNDEELYQMYILDNKKQRDIAHEYGVSVKTVGRWMKRSEIVKHVDEKGEKKVHNKRERPDDDELFTLYIMEDMSQAKLMEHYDISQTTLQRWLKDAELTKRGWYNKEEAE